MVIIEVAAVESCSLSGHQQRRLGLCQELTVSMEEGHQLFTISPIVLRVEGLCESKNLSPPIMVPQVS